MKHLLLTQAEEEELDAINPDNIEGVEELRELAKALREKLLGLTNLSPADLLYALVTGVSAGLDEDDLPVVLASAERALKIFMGDRASRYGLEIPADTSTVIVSGVAGETKEDRSFEFRLVDMRGVVRLLLESSSANKPKVGSDQQA